MLNSNVLPRSAATLIMKWIAAKPQALIISHYNVTLPTTNAKPEML